MQDFYANTIDEAAEKILILLKEDANAASSIGGWNNVLYFDGWEGLGASAVLGAIARRLTAEKEEPPAAAASASSSTAQLVEFEQIIHIDCSKWESRRALQRAVAEQLKLPAAAKVMEVFDTQDQEDDFRGVAVGSRAELQQVVREMYQHIQKLNHRILVIFHNGSGEEIDLARCCGISPSGYSTSKVLWTFQGRFRLKPRAKVDSALKSTTTTDAFLLARPHKLLPHEIWPYLVREEANELVAAQQYKLNTIVPRSIVIDQPALVEECLLYMLELCCRCHQSIDYDFTTHSANYWICDGIIKQRQQKDADDVDDGLWRIADALLREMQLDVQDHRCSLSYHLARFVESKPFWVSPTYGFSRQILVPRGDMFQHYLDKLRVLKLSHCTFDFPSAPFRCCHNLRFLWLDHCQVNEINTTQGVGAEDARCFQRLWVLDVRYTAGCSQILSTWMMDLMTHLRELKVVGVQKWDMGQLQGRLPNLRKLRVQESSIDCSCSENDLFSEANKMELLDFSGNKTSASMKSLCGPGVGSNNSCLETVTVGCTGWLINVSFKGCINLKNILLSGWVGTLDISNTAVKTLDLAKTYIHSLDELNLLCCEKLCAIKWPPGENKSQDKPGKLRIDTTQSSAQPARCGKQSYEESNSMGSLSSIAVLHGNQPVSRFDWYISVRDARLLLSLEPVYSSSRKIFVEISSTIVATGASEHESGSRSLMPVLGAQQQKQPVCALIYADVNQQHGDDDSNREAPGTTVRMWPCPDSPRLPKESCYIHIQDQRGAIIIPDFVTVCTKILHVKDSLSITILPSSPGWSSEWLALEWCRIERCPKLESVFGRSSWYYSVRILWASQLPKARCIWKGGQVVRLLTYLHLDFCSRLIHVLPLGQDMISVKAETGLETLEIVWCGDLREVFPLLTAAQRYVAREQPRVITLVFPKLKRIHLHELPTLHSICGPGLRMSAPELETVKIRGCWSLKHLPITVQKKKAVQCDCEKEWWHNLQWEDPSQKELYKPIHPKHYKKGTLLRGSVLSMQLELDVDYGVRSLALVKSYLMSCR
ncbi:hypothetical protein EJB05_15321, partial [Eragrostis curvula]